MAKDPREERKQALELTRAQIEKQFGKGAIIRLGDEGAVEDVETVSTGSLALDIALGIGGMPRGRIVEIYGPEGSGKTTVCLSTIGNAQKNGGVAAFIDAEHALDPGYARKLGVDIDNLLVSQPDTGEQALEICEMLVRSGAVDCIVIDSVAALVPRAEIEGEMGDTHVGLQARLMSQALRKLTGTIKKTNTLVIFTNQIRIKIGVMFGNPETTSGGNALKFYSSVRLDIRRIGAISEGENVTGSRVRVKVVKNKTAPPFRKCEFDILYGAGISREGDLIDLAVEHEIIKKSGAWFSYGEERLGQGRENVRVFLLENVDLCQRIEREVFEKVGIKTAKPSEEKKVGAAPARAAAEAGPAKPATKPDPKSGRAHKATA
ncbi:MAG TPA: recombinase RecA [Candidatus Krumholzibacteria bacterium]|jgi:recombination protein RecA